MANKVTTFFKKFIELLTPHGVGCINCGREIFEGELCEDCTKEFFKNDKRRCSRCSRPTVSVDDNICEQCKVLGETYFDKVFSPIVYTGVGLAMVRKFKFHERRDIGVYLAKFMACELDNIPSVDFMIAVPMWQGKYGARLYSTAEELATNLSDISGVSYEKDVVIKTRDTVSQTELSGMSRLDNVKGSFRVKKRALVKDKSILIIDDVFTTGATANEVARVLKNAGANKVFVLTATIAVKH